MLSRRCSVQHALTVDERERRRGGYAPSTARRDGRHWMGEDTTVQSPDSERLAYS
ncbi:hypothetical protein BC628DRAFT_1353470 [Trametes gibbosa]|nr:hypothetical protein BC628DRAFT_1353470 [Trametes gibbosa]